MTNPIIVSECEKFEEELPKLICDLVWSVTDGGCKLKPESLLSYQEEPIREFEDIKAFLTSSLERVLAERDEQINKWIDENEYCSKCCSPKKFCPDFGKYPSAVDTKDLLAFLNTK